MRLLNKFFSLEFLRFVFIGIINTLTHNGVYIVLLNFLPYLGANTIAFILSTIISFFLNCYFTFKVKPTLKKFIIFPISCLPNFVIQSTGITILIEYIKISKTYAAFCASIIAIPITFILMRFLIKLDPSKN